MPIAVTREVRENKAGPPKKQQRDLGLCENMEAAVEERTRSRLRREAERSATGMVNSKRIRHKKEEAHLAQRFFAVGGLKYRVGRESGMRRDYGGNEEQFFVVAEGRAIGDRVEH